jgi:hypothetical protein
VFGVNDLEASVAGLDQKRIKQMATAFIWIYRSLYNFKAKANKYIAAHPYL